MDTFQPSQLVFFTVFLLFNILTIHPKPKLCGWGPGGIVKKNLSDSNGRRDRLEPLGIFISYGTKQNDHYNFKTKIQIIQTIHDIWQSRNLTLFKRCLITKSLVLSQFVHPISILDIPNDYIKAADSAIFKFIWKKRKTKSSTKLCS